MELKQLRHFLAILEHGSISRAGAALGISQPALSQSLKGLERSLGAELLLRSGGGIRASAIGAEFARYARNIVREADKAAAEVAALRGSGPGSIAVGLHSMFARVLGPDLLADLLGQMPGLEFEIGVFTTAPEEVARRIQQARIDLALTLADPDWTAPSDVVGTRVADLPSQVYCRPDHPLALANDVALADLADYEWVVTRVGFAERVIAAAFAGEARRPHIRVRTDSMALMLALTARQPLLCLMPEAVAREEVEAGRLAQVRQSFVQARSAAVVMHSGLLERTPAMRRVAALFAQQVAL